MGRSVSYPSGAIVAFTSFDDDEGEFDDFVDNLKHSMRCMAPSMYDRDGWAGREDRILLRNNHAEFGVSEYCGLVAVWLRVRPDNDHEALAERWVETMSTKFSETFSTLRKIGTASNGESFFVETGR